ncbi:conserved hypothetical protein [Paraburkholderia piptadeniae]|uniref:Uncharacterized protein n=2 Tax=Paraburkholderia TaxID=1822464 RepID=A0A1N7SI51_9BURK|nr:hypothetical protein [Paraburkholderia piptadeniae]SIT46988.1 conserved hypothetical protein [Paraburkholderia piptadeniae]
MKDDTYSLRAQIEKWFGSAQPLSIRVSRALGDLRMMSGCKCVSVSQTSGPYAIVFFRHGDKSWRVYPPTATRPTLNAVSRVA